MADTAHAGSLVLEALQALLPPAQLDVSAWAAANRWVEGARPGLWDPLTAPYLTEPMESLSDELVSTTAIVGPGQCGKTSVAENWLLASVDTDPAPFLWYMQTDDAVKSYVKNTVNPLIEAHPSVASKQGLRPVDDSLAFKRFRQMSAQFLAATRSNLISKKGQRIVGDEIDAYDRDFGDPKVQFDVRRQTYGADSHLLAISHPDRATSSSEEGWNAGIMSIYADSDRRTWWWPCPHCNGWSSPNPNAERVCRLVYPEDAPLDEIQDAAALSCPICGADIADSQRRAMNREARWIRRGQRISEDGEVTGDPVRHLTAGFWIVGVMSPFLLHGIGGLARARVEAERARVLSGEDKSVREVMAKQWGIPFDVPRRHQAMSVEALVERAEPALQLRVVPIGTRFLTAAIDVQGNRFEIMVRAWGVGGESWIVDYLVVHADPGTSPGDWDALFADVCARSYPLADGSERAMRIRAVGCDSGGEAGVTLQAYDAWKRARTSRLATRAGRIDGREAWTLLLLKGSSGPNAQTLLVTYPDSARKDRFAGARGQVPVGFFAPNRLKDALSSQLDVADDGPWRVHLPAALKSEEAPHAFFEMLVAENRRPDGRWEKIKSGVRNEAIDLMVMTHAMAHLWGLARIDWSSPPSWAGSWDQNPLVIAAAHSGVEADADSDEPAAAPAPAPVAAPIRRRSLADMWR